MAFIEWLGIVEGHAEDARGAPTFVGVNRNVIIAPELPTQRNPLLVVLIEEDVDETLDPGSTVRLTFSVEDPDGVSIFTTTSSGHTGEKQWPDIPASFSLILQAPLSFEAYGTYTIRCVAQHASWDEPLTAEKRLFVVEGG